MRTKQLATLVLLSALSACAPSTPDASRNAQPAATAPRATSAATPAATPASTAAAKPRFTDRVWRVESSTAVAPGTLYTFLSDGTLVISSEQSTTAYGRWTYESGKLVMIEEGIAYPTDILALDDTSFAIRSHNPGEPVDIKLAAASDIPLPKPPAK
ncbi:MAG: hypothetical protein ACREPX_15085 [Rhodanobacteraceae bacterium]